MTIACTWRSNLNKSNPQCRTLATTRVGSILETFLLNQPERYLVSRQAVSQSTLSRILLTQTTIPQTTQVHSPVEDSEVEELEEEEEAEAEANPLSREENFIASSMGEILIMAPHIPKQEEDGCNT